MKTKKTLSLVMLMLAMTAFISGFDRVFAQTVTDPTVPGYAGAIPLSPDSKMADALSVREKSGNMRSVTNRIREAAAAERAASQANTVAQKISAAPQGAPLAAAAVMNPGGMPDYFNMGNWAYSPIIPKFVDTLPGLGIANQNNLNQYIPIAVKDINAYPGSDYYQIGLVDFNQQMHSSLPTTKLRGYRDLAPGSDGAAHYLGPLIIATKDRPVRVKYTNMLPISTDPASNMFLPVDTTVMGAGTGPNGGMYSQNRTELHLHGGASPWISDGTPHQWFTPAGDPTPYKTGASFQQVPDMLPVPAGSATYYYTNQQTARLMFYHDHSLGLTRLGVYGGQAAGYLVTDQYEEAMISAGNIPSIPGVYKYGIPLIIQDKTFVDATTITATDPTWNWGSTPPVPRTGDLWFPHVYMPNQNPAVLSGSNAFGRWDYGPWFWPPVTGITNQPILIAPGVYVPGTPNPSLVPESFMDTPIVNGTAYPKMTVTPTAYRFRILNACNDRYLNLQLYYTDPADPNKTEVKMVPAIPPAVPTPTWPATWPTDGRAGGVPDPTTVGPNIIQIGTEGGFLPAAVDLPNQPVNFDYNRRSITVLNVLDKTLYLGPAERADVIIDFSSVPSGSSIILYNDAPTPMPAFDTRFDFYTGNPDQTPTGGAPSTLAGFGPNTRTIMRFDVSGAPTGSFNLAALQTALTAAYASPGSQAAPVIPQTTYPAPNNAATDTYSTIQASSLTYTPVGGATPVTTIMESKAIHELFEIEYGKMNSILGVELPFTNFNTQTTVPLSYIDPPTEVFTDGDTQIWKITHNGVDTHAIHFHLFNVQVINRVGWDGAIKPPDANELGWKETVRMNPLEDCIVAMRAILPTVPFTVPDSIRLLNPARPAFDTTGFSIQGPNGQPVSISNVFTNFGAEYVWHCHLLGHEENDMMRPMAVMAAGLPPSAPATPTNLIATVQGNPQISLAWTDNASNETGYWVQRAVGAGAFSTLATLPANSPSYIDNTVVLGTTYSYQIMAFNASGQSLPSNTLTVTMGSPAAPALLTATPSVLSASPPIVVLGWVDNANNASGFLIQRATNATFTSGLSIYSIATPTYTDTSVVRGMRYYYRVLASNGFGSSAFSNTAMSVVAGQLSNPPANVTAAMGNGKATISFTPPVPNGSSIVMSYTVTASPGGKTVTGSASPLTMVGLMNGTSYSFTVTAFNSSGSSAPSLPSVGVIPATLPGAPTAVTALGGNGQATVSFNPPLSNGGSAVTSYTVTSNPGAFTVSGVAGPLIMKGLTNGTVYTFTVRATNAMGTGPVSAVTLAVKPGTVPGAPAIGTATAGIGQASVTFTAPVSNGGNPITSYTATSAPGGFTATKATSPITVTGLTGGSSYSFTVTATTVIGTGAPSQASNAVTPKAAVPGAPTAVTAVRGNTQATVAFTAPLANGSAITSYTVTSSPGAKTATGAASPLTVTGLANGTSYTFTVKATNGVGTSLASVASAAVIPATVPNAPTIGVVTPGVLQASVAFTAPTFNGGSAVTGYTVTSNPGGFTKTGTASPLIVTGLTYNVPYTFTVTAVNVIGTSAPSAASLPATPKATVPGAPTAVKAVRGNTQATVSFTPPVSNGGAVITGYTVTSVPGGKTAAGTASPLTVTGLTNGTSYTFTVKATNAIGLSLASVASVAVTPATLPNAPTIGAVTAGVGQVTVAFTAPVSNGGSVVTGYTVTSNPGGIMKTGTASPLIVAGLTYNVPYTFTVTAMNVIGTSVPSSASAIAIPKAAVPGAPTAVTAVRGSTQATVSFTPPVSNGGTPITSYTVTSSGVPAKTTSGAGSPLTVTGLTNGTAYTFTVKATNVIGSSLASAASIGVTPATVPNAPAKPNVTAGNGQVTVAFTAPANGGSAITGYAVTSNPGGIVKTGTASPLIVTGLTYGVQYTFTVTAANALGTSVPSAPSNIIAPMAVLPGAPTAVTGVRGNTQVAVSFIPPVSNGGASISSYTVTSTVGAKTATGTASPITVTGLTNGTAYSFTVKATNAIGAGPASAVSAALTPATVPGAPAIGTAVRGTGRATVPFTPPASNGGSAITLYTATSSPGGITATNTVTPITVLGLTPGTPYTFTVAAKNVVGTGLSSTASNQVTP